MQKRIRIREEAWERFRKHIPTPTGRGRRALQEKGCFEALIYILRTGCQWCELPKEYPPKSTVHDAKTRWLKHGVIEELWKELLLEFDDLQGLEWEWLSADGANVKAPLGGEATGKKSDGSSQAGV
jgi:transposase